MIKCNQLLILSFENNLRNADFKLFSSKRIYCKKIEKKNVNDDILYVNEYIDIIILLIDFL